MARLKRRSILPTGALFGLLLGAVVIPAVLAITVGIVSLILWREAFDIVFGVLVLSFAAMALTGGIVAIAFLKRSARLAEMQTDFIANVSHELRTPVAGIKLLAETLSLGRPADPVQREAVFAGMNAEVRRLEDLVARILTWRRMEAGVTRFQRDPQSVEGLIGEAVDAASGAARGKAARIETHIEADIPAVIGDRDALVDAFRNLIDNAIKFGGADGPVEVSVRREGDEVVVEVKDRGPGIAPTERKRIFERFYRAPMPDRSAQGTGLGLAIVQRVVKAHRARLQLESEPGNGSEFTIRLPIAPPERPSPTAAPSSS